MHVYSFLLYIDNKVLLPFILHYLGRVHHLSGPNNYTVTLIHLKTSESLDFAPIDRLHQRSLSLHIRVSHPLKNTNYYYIDIC